MTYVRDTRELRDGWELARSAPGKIAGPEHLDGLAWQPAPVPGTVAGAIGNLRSDPDSDDWWYRIRFAAEMPGPDQQLVLCLDGIATIAEVFLNGARILSSRSMFAAHEVDISSRISASNELVICCRALAPELRVRRRPRARWRTALVDGNLRFFRTMLLGRAPGFAPGPAVVGPWRPVRLERRSGFVLEEVRLRPRVAGDLGPRVAGDTSAALAIRLTGRPLGGSPHPVTVTVVLEGPTDTYELTLATEEADGRFWAEGELQVPSVAMWWPHTHGNPTLYRVTLSADGAVVHRGHVGFRALGWPTDWEETGLVLRVNGVDVFARGAVWTPLDMSAPHQPAAAVRRSLEQVMAAGMNMLRIAGVGCYESDVFHDLCDELGILVWQDMMLANLDYPAGEPDWDVEFESEVRQELGRIAGRPSLAVLCGGSEVAQQVAMIGLDPELGRGQPYTGTLPHLIEEAGAAVPYVPNSPWGGMVPFRPDHGVANYYGVGAYLRELSDARLADVKFAGECLAFANVPDDAALEQIDAPGGLVPHHPAWKAGVPRDAGAGWDFDDVRDHYLSLLYGKDPVQLRWTDMRSYLALSRAVTGEVMSEVFGEWRRRESRCAGALILWLKDLSPGPGWGVIDHRGEVKPVYHYLRRALAPAALWLVDEGLAGMDVHVANDREEPLEANLRIALYRDLQTPVEQTLVEVSIPARGSARYGVEELLGRFVDVGLAYRFGPPGHDVVAASLERGTEPGQSLIANAFRFPVGRPLIPEPVSALGLTATLSAEHDGTAALNLKSDKLVYGVSIEAEGLTADDNWFILEPGVARAVALRGSGVSGAGVTVDALNLAERIRVAMP